MKKIKLILSFILLVQYSFAQTVIKDIDFDGKSDSVYINPNLSTIVCVLSTQNYKPTSSKVIEVLNETSGIQESKNGFIFYNNWMRAGYKCQFRYNIKTKKIQLIGMSRYEFGNATNDGSGESSVNLLTGNYIGNWNYFDELANHNHGELKSIPTIKSKMKFKEINLEIYSDEIYFDYSERCAKLFEKYKKISKSK